MKLRREGQACPQGVMVLTNSLLPQHLFLPGSGEPKIWESLCSIGLFSLAAGLTWMVGEMGVTMNH